MTELEMRGTVLRIDMPRKIGYWFLLALGGILSVLMALGIYIPGDLSGIAVHTLVTYLVLFIGLMFVAWDFLFAVTHSVSSSWESFLTVIATFAALIASYAYYASTGEVDSLVISIVGGIVVGMIYNRAFIKPALSEVEMTAVVEAEVDVNEEVAEDLEPEADEPLTEVPVEGIEEETAEMPVALLAESVEEPVDA